MPQGKRSKRRTVGRLNGDGTQLNVSWQLQEAGFEPGDEVTVEPKDGYVVIKDPDADEYDLNVEDRENIPNNPLQSRMEATMVGNRLWRMGELLRESGYDNVADETQHMARRFHAVANGSKIEEDFSHE